MMLEDVVTRGGRHWLGWHREFLWGMMAGNRKKMSCGRFWICPAIYGCTINRHFNSTWMDRLVYSSPEFMWAYFISPVSSWESRSAENGFHLPFLHDHFEFKCYILNLTNSENIENLILSSKRGKKMEGSVEMFKNVIHLFIYSKYFKMLKSKYETKIGQVQKMKLLYVSKLGWHRNTILQAAGPSRFPSVKCPFDSLRLHSQHQSQG